MCPTMIMLIPLWSAERLKLSDQGFWLLFHIVWIAIPRCVDLSAGMSSGDCC